MLYNIVMFGAFIAIFALPISWIETGLMLLILWFIHKNYRKPGGI